MIQMGFKIFKQRALLYSVKGLKGTIIAIPLFSWRAFLNYAHSLFKPESQNYP